jgi:hypothetical protein
MATFFILAFAVPAVSGYLIYRALLPGAESNVTNNYATMTVTNYCSATYNCGPDARRYVQCYYPCFVISVANRSDINCDVSYKDGRDYSQSQYAIEAAQRDHPIASTYNSYYTDGGSCSTRYRGLETGGIVAIAVFSSLGVFFVNMICLMLAVKTLYCPSCFINENSTPSNLQITVVPSKQ